MCSTIHAWPRREAVFGTGPKKTVCVVDWCVVVPKPRACVWSRPCPVVPEPRVVPWSWYVVVDAPGLPQPGTFG